MKTRTQKILILSVIFLSMFILNMITPLIMDDFNYTFGLDGRINSLLDIINYQSWFYSNWGGRNVAHTIAQFFLMNDKLLFNFLNAIVYTVLIYLIYRIIRGKNEEHPIYLLGIHFVLWFFSPVFGQSFIWLTGSCNYLWTTTIILIFINLFIDFHNNDKKYSILKIALFGFLGILAGWTNENAGASLVFMGIAYLIVEKFVSHKKINKIIVTGIIGTIIGFVIMILAPGNYARSTYYPNEEFFLFSWIKNAISITQTGINYFYLLIVAIVIIISIYVYHKQKIDKIIYFFLFGIVVGTYSMIVSPTFPERSWTIVLIYIVIIFGNLLSSLKEKSRLKIFIIVDAIIISSFLFINSYLLASKDSYHFYNIWQERIEEIEQGKKKEIEDYEFEPFYTTRKQSASFGLGDIFEGKDDPNNMCYARYFNVKSIKAKTSEK